MKRIKVTHFLQDPSHCAVAACAVAANHYNPKIDYEYTKKLSYKKISKKIGEEGLDTGQICILLNNLGFRKVTLLTSDFTAWDYSWKKFGSRKILEALKESLIKKKDREEKSLTRNLIKWVSSSGNKSVIKITYDFGRYMRAALNKHKPVILTFNWTMFFEFAKENDKGEIDVANGEGVDHAVVANGYDKNGIWIVDSHHNFYTYSRKKYKKGFYKISWEHLFTCMGQGDVIIPEDYVGND